MAKPILSNCFPFVGSSELERMLDIKKNQRAELKRRLPKPLYWFQFPGGRKIFWNLNLVRDYLLHGDCPNHQRLVEQYLQTLPTAK
jgi:hypothetical protein